MGRHGPYRLRIKHHPSLLVRVRVKTLLKTHQLSTDSKHFPMQASGNLDEKAAGDFDRNNKDYLFAGPPLQDISPLARPQDCPRCYVYDALEGTHMHTSYICVDSFWTLDTSCRNLLQHYSPQVAAGAFLMPGLQQPLHRSLRERALQARQPL